LLQHGFDVVDREIYGLLERLQEKKIKHIALTARGTSSYFTRNLLEVWCSQLANLKLCFQAFPLFSRLTLENERFEGKKVIYDKDILYTEGVAKDTALEVFCGYVSSIFTLKKLYVIEDSLKNLKLLEAWCKLHGIEFVGYHFTAVEKWHEECPVDEAHMRAQIKHLVDNKVWLSDEEVLKIMIEKDRKGSNE
jgi:hypothetical protein